MPVAVPGTKTFIDTVTAFANSVPQLDAATASTGLPSIEICTGTAEFLSL